MPSNYGPQRNISSQAQPDQTNQVFFRKHFLCKISHPAVSTPVRVCDWSDSFNTGLTYQADNYLCVTAYSDC